MIRKTQNEIMGKWRTSAEPLASICSITYNHESFINQCLDGFLMQETDFPFEILIHDDASTDKTAAVIREYEKNYPAIIKPILKTINQYSQDVKPNPVYNYPRAKGKYIALCDGDDYWTDSYKLQKQVDFLEANPDYSLCWCRFKTLNEDTGEFQVDQNEKLFESGEDKINFDFERIYKGWHMGTQTLVFGKSMYDPSYLSLYKSPKDIHLVSHLLLQGKGACLSFLGAVYRKHAGGVYSGASELQNAKISCLAYKEIYKHNKKIYYLKLKYLLFTKRYIDALLGNKKYAAAFLKSVELFGQEKNVRYFLSITRRIISQKIKQY